MAKDTLTVRVEAETREALKHIRQGLREAEAGKFVPEREVQKVLTRLRRR